MSVAALARIEELLDVLPVTDRVFHDLRRDEPLVQVLVNRVASLTASGRVLLVGPNALLPEALLQAGYELDVWHIRHGILTDAIHSHVVREGPLDSILAKGPRRRPYDVIVLPYILEAASLHPIAVLAGLRGLLAPGGYIVVAARQSGALETRLAALRGRPAVADPELADPQISFSWPPLASRRSFGPAELGGWSLRTGFRVRDVALTVDRRPAVATNAMGLMAWAGACLSVGVKRRVPGLRDCLVATLAPHPLPSEDGTAQPLVTIVVRSGDRARTDALLEQIDAQHYSRIEVIVVHPREPTFAGLKGRRLRAIVAERPDGPVAANQAARLARGELMAFTDDLCRLPAGWAEAAVGAMTGWTVAVTGGVRAQPGSARPILVLPGSRPTEHEEKWFGAANSIYNRAAFLEAGGFDETFEAPVRLRPGWDNDLAYRLRALGYTVRFDPGMELDRLFPFPRRRDWLLEEYRNARELPELVHSSPGLGGAVLRYGIFASPRTMAFDLALAGVLLAVVIRNPIPLLLGIPWIVGLMTFLPIWPPSEWRHSVRHLRGMVVRHGIWLCGLLTGSLRARRLVL